MHMSELVDMPWFCFTPSTACNIKCSYCSQSDVRTNTISTDLLQDKTLLEFISYIPPTHLFISGGEPLILPGMREFVNFASGYGHKISFDTNLCIPVKKLEDYLSYWSAESMCYWNISHHLVCDIKLEYIMERVALLQERGISNFVKYVGVPEMLPQIKQNMIKLMDKGIGAAVTIIYGNWLGKRMPGDYTIEESVELLDMVTLNTFGLQLFDGVLSKGLSCRAGQDYIFYNMKAKDEVIPCCHGSQFPININKTFFATGDRSRTNCGIGNCLGDVMLTFNINGVMNEADRFDALCAGKSKFLGAESVVKFINEEIIQKGYKLTNYRKFLEVEKFLAGKSLRNSRKHSSAEKKEGNMKIIKRVEIESTNTFNRYSDWQNLYMDQNTGRLIPDTEIWSGGQRIIRINALGCKGNDPETGIPIVGFFGDSATFGASFSEDSWSRHLNIRGCQPLNAAVEGYNLDAILARYRELSQRVNFACVVAYTGWHNIIYNETGEKYWKAKLEEFAGDHVLAFCTLATCLTEECRVKGLDSLICTDSPRNDYANYFEYNLDSLNKRYFNFWCNIEPTLENITKIVDGVQRYNDFLRRFCSERGHVLIDLHSYMLPSSYENIPEDFYDVCHPRPSVYQKIGRYIGSAIEEPLKDFLQKRTDKFFIETVNPVSSPEAFGITGKDVVPVGNCDRDYEDLRKNIYPLW